MDPKLWGQGLGVPTYSIKRTALTKYCVFFFHYHFHLQIEIRLRANSCSLIWVKTHTTCMVGYILLYVFVKGEFFFRERGLRLWRERKEEGGREGENTNVCV